MQFLAAREVSCRHTLRQTPFFQRSLASSVRCATTMSSFATPFFSLVRMHTNHLAKKHNYFDSRMLSVIHC